MRKVKAFPDLIHEQKDLVLQGSTVIQYTHLGYKWQGARFHSG